MRRTVWIWVVVAFVVGLMPGLGVAWWVRSDSLANRAQLVSRNSTLHGENQQLQSRLNASETTVSALVAKLSQAQAAGGGSASSTAATGAASGGTPSGPPDITERAVSPQKVRPDGKLTLTVKLKGHATRVNMRIAGRSGGFDKTYFLARESYNSAGEVWQKVITAPSGAGEYRYYSIAYDEAGRKYTMPGVSGWSFLVE